MHLGQFKFKDIGPLLGAGAAWPVVAKTLQARGLTAGQAEAAARQILAGKGEAQAIQDVTTASAATNWTNVSLMVAGVVLVTVFVLGRRGNGRVAVRSRPKGRRSARGTKRRVGR